MWDIEDEDVKIVIDGFGQTNTEVWVLEPNQIELYFTEEVSSIKMPVDSNQVHPYRGDMVSKKLGWVGVILKENRFGKNAFSISLNCKVTRIDYTHGAWWITFTEEI